MTAPFPSPALSAIQAEIVTLIAAISDAQCRRRISDAWLCGNIDGDGAMECLIELGLIEFTPEAAP